MFLVACSGFPVPVSRYWGAFPAVEISDTEIAMPGRGSIRRWIRESPDDFGFTVLGPKVVGDSGFKKTKDVKAALEPVVALADELGARAIVFNAPAKFRPNKNTKATLKAFLQLLPKDGPVPVFDLPSWTHAHLKEASGRRQVVLAYDPLHDETPESGPFTYIRLPGPAGHRSRYDEPAIASIAKHIKGLPEGEGFCVFCNIDMQTNGTQLLNKLK